jgi:ABC-type nickel/cobalt efflux system permease component RcnA
MQRGRGAPEPPKAYGTEAWLPALVLAMTHIALFIALICFLVVAAPLKARNDLPRVLIPAAMTVAAILALWMLWRAGRALLVVRKALKHR